MLTREQFIAVKEQLGFDDSSSINMMVNNDIKVDLQKKYTETQIELMSIAQDNGHKFYMSYMARNSKGSLVSIKKTFKTVKGVIDYANIFYTKS